MSNINLKVIDDLVEMYLLLRKNHKVPKVDESQLKKKKKFVTGKRKLNKK